MSQRGNPFYAACVHGMELANMYSQAYLQSFQEALANNTKVWAAGSVSEKAEPPGLQYAADSIYERWLGQSDRELKELLNSRSFISSLSKYTESLLDMRALFRSAGYPVEYFDRLFHWLVRSSLVFSMVPKEYHLAPFDVVSRQGKTRLLRYRPLQDADAASKRQPLLIIYAPINTFHVLDLNPRRSVVRNLLRNGGLDIFVLDWGYADRSDNNLSLDDYVGYVSDAVRRVKEMTGQHKVSILAYCWGGIFATIYSSLSSDVRNLILMAAPVDFGKDATVLGNWSRTVDVDRIVDEFGHMDGQVLDLAFLMRNPPRYGFDKYVKLFQRMFDAEFVDTFIDVERWLYDTPPVPGLLHRQIIDDLYRNNLLVSGKMQIASNGSKQNVDLRKITVPVLSIVAESDDLVTPECSLAINDQVSSKDKSVLRISGGHVALCVSNDAHNRLWPEVAKWIAAR